MSAPPEIEAYLSALRSEVQQALERVVVALGAPSVIADPIRYALMAPGKRLRPCLTLAAADSVGAARGLDGAAARARAWPAACAVEMVHTYSLVHDDLPAMDDDALRRGRPTTHIVYGDGLAILAGDGLLTDAFATLAQAPSPAARPGDPEASPDRRLRAVATLAAAAGSVGMVGGQALDLAAAGADASNVAAATAALEDMHARKTGALIRAATVMGAILADGDERQIAAIDSYARDLGLAFQIVDDVLDVEGSAADLGKTAGKDAAAGKLTFPALHGVEASRRMAAACVERARASLADAGLTGRLDAIAAWSVGRRR